MKRLILSLCIAPLMLQAQQKEMQLADCQQLAAAHFPYIKEKDLLGQIEKEEIKNVGMARLPQNELAAQGTYQSAVPSLPVQLPGISIPAVGKDQFIVTDETDVLLYDGGRTSAQKAIVKARSLIEQQKTAVDLYALRSEVTRVYANIIEMDTRLELLQLLKQNVEDRVVKVKAGVEAGTVLAANLFVLQAEILGIDQRIDEDRSDRKGLIAVMTVYTGDPLDAATHFQLPGSEPQLKDSITRPEIVLYADQRSSYSAQRKMLDANVYPQLNAFFQGGVGKPGLNILDNDVKAFYITGVKMRWSLGSFYTSRREKDVLRKQQEIVDAQRETFELRINAQLVKQKEEINKIKSLLQQDNEIITIRTKVRDISADQLDAGVITSSDYLIELNAQNQALVNQKLHNVQLIFAYIQYKLIAG